MEHLNSLDLSGLSGKRLLITGAAGFIGSHLTNMVCEAGATVYGTSRVERTSNRENFTWLTCSFDDIETVRYHLEQIKPDIIYHLSGAVTGSTDIKNVHATYHSLVTSTVNLLTVATEIGCERIILIGSCREPANQDENPNSPYAIAKWAASAYGKMFWECYQTPVTIVRTFVTYGPGQPSGMLIPHVIRVLLNQENPKLSSGKWLTDWIYIDDVVEGIIAASLADGVKGTTIDLGTGVLTSVKDVVLKIEKNISSGGKPLFGALSDRTSERTLIADVEKTFAKLKWRATTTLDNGLDKTINAIRKSIPVRLWFYGHYLSEFLMFEGFYA